MKRQLLSALVMGLIAGASHAADAAKSSVPAAHQASGIDVQYMDKGVRAQDDFFRYLNGEWLKKTEIPADKPSWGSFYKLYDDTQPQLLGIIEMSARGERPAGSNEQKIGDFYNSFMDEAKVESLGLNPLKDELARIAALSDKAQLPALMAHFSRRGVASPFDFGIHQDNKDSTKYVADISQGGLGLPDREYYLNDDGRMANYRAKYLAHVEKTLSMAGDAKAADHAKAIIALETAMAKVQWTRVENRDPIKTYNKVEVAKLGELLPGFDWKAWLEGVGVAQKKVTYVIVSQPTYLKGLKDVIAATDVDTWKAYFTWHMVSAYSPYLSKAFVDQRFAFYGTALSGVTENRPRWKRGVSTVEGALGEVIGQQYVQLFFPAERKARMEAMVKNLLAAYKQSIDTLDWMSPATKKEAQAKLAKFTPKIGYPNKWKDYSGLVVKRDDLVGNVMRSRDLEHQREVNKLGRPIDRAEWGMTPQTINAYYNPELNEIVFPAAILQPPFFNASADDAVNYGAIGAVIGHEISHGFDDQGSQYDGKGNLRDWWTKDDHANFEKKTSMLVAQYDAFSPVPGVHVNGKLTLGENIADNSGVAIAYKAYKLSLKGKPAPVIDGLTGEQRFYMGFGQVWRSKAREDALVAQLKTDPHSPGEFRANGPLRNQAGFYDAFGVKAGDKMFLDPKDRVTIW